MYGMPFTGPSSFKLMVATDGGAFFVSILIQYFADLAVLRVKEPKTPSLVSCSISYSFFFEDEG